MRIVYLALLLVLFAGGGASKALADDGGPYLYRAGIDGMN